MPPADRDEGSDRDTDAQALLDAIAAGRSRTESNSANAQRSEEQREADDRSYITRTVMAALRYGLPITVVLLLVLSWLEPAAAPEAIKAVVEIFKSVLLPVMTLVLGYYFGRGGKV